MNVIQPLLHQHLLLPSNNEKKFPIFPWQIPSNIHSKRNLSLKAQALPSKTQRIMESISVTEEVGGAGGAYSYAALKRLDQLWSNICSTQTVAKEPPKVVSSEPGLFSKSDLSGKEVETFDVLVCGGTLGIFIATALSYKGLRVGVVERNILRGREQEWNVSRKELLELVEVGILEESDFEQVISATFNPNRCGFEGRGEIWVEEILNLGVSPVKLIEVMKKRFNSLGGVTFEGCSVSSICVYEDVAVLQLAEGKILSGRLILDAMGNFSPIVRQIRKSRKPNGVCLVVGSCCRGFEDNSTSDVIFSSSAVKKVGKSEAQYFWEAFPAGSGPLDRTTYMFTYVDPKPECPKLEELLEDYWELMPKYQFLSGSSQSYSVHITGSPTIIACSENLREVFTVCSTCPLPSAFDRVLQFGDASGIQSPVSFGGFGSLTRHLGRLSNGIYEAISDDLLDIDNLSLLNPYMPNLSASWLFQRAMSAKKQSNVSPEFINELLYANFQSTQDVIQFGPLVKTLAQVMVSNPQIIPSILKQVGIQVLVDWSGHFFMLGYYTILSTVLDPAIRPLVDKFPTKMKYKCRRQLEAWKYGAGLDYEYKPSYLTKAQVNRKMSNKMDTGKNLNSS